MEKPISEQMRIRIWKQFQVQYFSIDECIKYYQLTLYRMQNSKNIYHKVLYPFIISILYADTYKMLNYRILKNIQTYDDMKLLNKMDELEDIDQIDDLLAEVSSDPEFLYALIQNAYQFINCPFPAKVVMMKSLAHRDNVPLEEMFPFHQEDRDYYDRTVDTNFLLTMYEQTEKLASIDENIAGYDLNHAIDNIRGFICEMAILDTDAVESLMEEMIIIDYKWSKYLLQHAYYQIEQLRLEALERIELLEDPEMEIKDIINFYLNDDDLLIPLIESVIDIKQGNINITSKETIKEFDIDSYYRKHVPRKVKNKLRRSYETIS